MPGEALRAALLQPDLKPHPRGLSISAAYITGEVDLSEFRIPYSLRFPDCAFEQPLNWNRLTISGMLGLAGCVTLSVNLGEAEIKGSALLRALRATGEVRAIDATIGGQLNLEGAILTNEGGYVLWLGGAEIKSHVFLKGLRATGGVQAIRLHRKHLSFVLTNRKALTDHRTAGTPSGC